MRRLLLPAVVWAAVLVAAGPAVPALPAVATAGPAASGPADDPGLVVLMYHHFADHENSSTVSPQRFAEQMAWLKQAGVQPDPAGPKKKNAAAVTGGRTAPVREAAASGSPPPRPG